MMEQTQVEHQRQSSGNETADALRLNEFYLSEGQRLAHTGSWALDPAGFFSHWSHELLRMYGLDPGREAPNLEEYLALIHPQDREFMARTLEKMVAEGLGCDLKKRIVRPNGEVRYIRCVGVPVFENGSLKSIVGTAMDITEQEELTQELRRREAYLAEAQRLSRTGSFGWNYGATGELTWSEETYRICGFDSSIKPTHELVRDRVHPDDLQAWQQAFDRAAEGKEVDFENRLVMPDGTVKFLHSVAYGVQKDGKLVELVGTVRDITEHKLAEEAIRRSEAFLAEGQRLSHTGSWGWNASTGKVTWSQEHFRILGLDPQDTIPSLDVHHNPVEIATQHFWERVHPDDRIGLRRTFE